MMNDPFGSMNGFLNQFKGFVQDPARFIMQRKMGLSPDAFQHPQAAVQQLMNNGQLSQQQFNQLQQTAHRITKNPLFMQMFWQK